MASYLDRWARREIKRLMVFMPPQNGKSELVSRRLPAFVLGKYPDARFVGTSYAAELASSMNRDVQRIIDGRKYQSLFPETTLFGSNVRTVAGNTWIRNNDAFEVVGRRGSYRCAGVGGSLAGFGYEYGAIDDPFKDKEEAYSPTIRRKVLGWYNTVFSTRQGKDACILITQTRWGREDLSGALVKLAEDDPEADQWVIVRFPAIQDAEPTVDDPRAFGEPLWPARYSADWLDRKRRGMTAAEWSALYQQSPTPEGGSEWPPEYFRSSIWFDDWPRDLWYRVIAVDPSKGKDAKFGDYSGIILLGIDAQGDMWVDADLKRRRAEQIVEDGLEHQRRFKAEAFVIEVNQFQELLADQFDRVSGDRGVPLPIWTIDNRVKKEVRIRRLGPYLAKGRIHFKGGSPGANLLVEQLIDFPNAEHDDGPDALEMAIRHAREHAGVADDEVTEGFVGT